MNNFTKIIITLLFLTFVVSCAKPKVVEIAMPGDEKLSCDELKDEVAETQKIKRDAEYAKEGTGGNVARAMLFWPAWAQTLHNADVAIIAAKNRNYHLLKIMKNKKCKGVDTISSQIKESSNTKNIAAQLRDLNDMYESGILTKEEFEIAKKKTLNQ